MSAKVISRLGTRYILAADDGEVSCVARKQLPPLAVGDWVEWQPTSEGEGVIEALVARDNVLTRPDPLNQFDKPVAANIDLMVVVVATSPSPDLDLVDEYLVLAESLGIAVALVHTKQDMADFSHTFATIQPFQALGYPLLAVSNQTEEGLAELQALMAEKTCVLLGQSGVGKSSLINCLLPEAHTIKTQALDEKQEGRHTTSHSTLYRLSHGAEIIDSPGIREFGLWKLSEDTIRQGFVEIYQASAQCKFHNCRHLKEPKCAVKQQVEAGEIDSRRYRHYCQLVEAV